MELKRQDPASYRFSNPHAYKLGQAAAKKDNVERFLMGRQMFVVFIVFFAAKLTTIHSKVSGICCSVSLFFWCCLIYSVVLLSIVFSTKMKVCESALQWSLVLCISVIAWRHFVVLKYKTLFLTTIQDGVW